MIALRETRFSVNKLVHLCEVSEYELFYNDHDNRGGGFCMYVNRWAQSRHRSPCTLILSVREFT